MSFMGSFVGALSLTLVFGAAVFAQETQNPPADNSVKKQGKHKEGRGHRMGRPGGLGFGLRKLNLTEEQRAQLRQIMERHRESTKAQRDELAQLRQKRAGGSLTVDDEARANALRQELRASRESIHVELRSILTDEQRAKLQELETERRARMGDRMRRRQPPSQ